MVGDCSSIHGKCRMMLRLVKKRVQAFIHGPRLSPQEEAEFRSEVLPSPSAPRKERRWIFVGNVRRTQIASEGSAPKGIPRVLDLETSLCRISEKESLNVSQVARWKTFDRNHRKAGTSHSDGGKGASSQV